MPVPSTPLRPDGATCLHEVLERDMRVAVTYLRVGLVEFDEANRSLGAGMNTAKTASTGIEVVVWASVVDLDAAHGAHARTGAASDVQYGIT